MAGGGGGGGGGGSALLDVAGHPLVVAGAGGGGGGTSRLDAGGRVDGEMPPCPEPEKKHDDSDGYEKKRDDPYERDGDERDEVDERPSCRP